jgi:hypothetical protein
MKEQWILYDISDRLPSRNEADEFFILKFFNTSTREKNTVYITVGYRNNAWWGDYIINDAFGIYEFKSFKTTRSGLIDGDSVPVLVNRTSFAEANTIVDIMSGVRETIQLRGEAL